MRPGELRAVGPSVGQSPSALAGGRHGISRRRVLAFSAAKAASVVLSSYHSLARAGNENHAARFVAGAMSASASSISIAASTLVAALGMRFSVPR